MYGLVNNAIESMIRAERGDAAWLAVRTKAGVDVEDFITMHPYNDELTYALVGAASEHLGTPTATLLEAFGRYWVEYTAQDGYGELFKLYGSSLSEFIKRLDEMNSRVALSFPDLRPPSFRSERVEDGEIRIHYHSERAGLAPFVLGLLCALSEHFETPADVELVESRDQGHDHEVFSVVIR